AAPDFTFTAIPTSQPVAQGASTSIALNIVALNSFNGTVNLVATGAPAGSTVTFSPTSVTGSGLVTMNLAGPVSAPLGINNVVVTGSSGALSHSAPVTITVTPQGTSSQFTLSPPISGPNVTGTSQRMTATLRDSAGAPIAGSTIEFTVTGANA